VNAPLTWLRKLTATATAGGLLLLAAPFVAGYGVGVTPLDLMSSKPHHNHGRHHAGHHGRHRKGHHHAHRHPNRKMLRYTVRPGDTATGLAVRFHAWTDELIAVNHLGPSRTLYAGERITIPVVRSAARKARRHRHHHHPSHHRAARHHRHHASRHHASGHHASRHHRAHYPRDPSRAAVRRIIVRTARRHGVDPYLALAVSWQEAGWQMDHVSSASAVGAMQVLPATGRWLSVVVGRRLHLHDVHDNVTAGVVLLQLLRREAPVRFAIAGYYQGLGSVRANGMYPDTEHYVANVLDLAKALRHGWSPA
jgi:LysM repeat protein